MFEILMKRLQQAEYPTGSRSVLLSDGSQANLSTVAVRRGPEGSVSFLVVESATGETTWLYVSTPSGQKRIEARLPAEMKGDAVEAALSDAETLKKVIQLFPHAQAEAFGARGRARGEIGL
jgi:hypothetical protein